MYDWQIHKSAVPKKIHPLHHGLYFYPLLLGFLLEKSEKLLTKGENLQKRVDRLLVTHNLILNALAVSTVKTLYYKFNCKLNSVN